MDLSDIFAKDDNDTLAQMADSFDSFIIDNEVIPKGRIILKAIEKGSIECLKCLLYQKI